jgi:Histidine kinase-, DNA gyrase B-, and HSP90-like ATPase
MNVAEVLEIALANSDQERVEVMALEPAAFSTEAVAGLAELVHELASNAIESSPPEEKVRVAGLFISGTYLISISDRGAGISEAMMGALNRLLEEPDAAGRNADLGIGLRLVARIAARNGLSVRLVPGAPGTTARVTVPAKLVQAIDATDPEPVEEESLVDPIPVLDIRGGRIYAVPASAGDQTEVFLEKVFAPLRLHEPGLLTPAIDLQVRVPGESYLESEDDSPSTVAAEGAVDLRSALSTFDEGRRSAEAAVDLTERVDRAG